MNFLITSVIKIAPLILWIFLCGIGGLWITRALFRLHPDEEVWVGFAIGLISEIWLVNLLGRVIPFFNACLISGFIILATGILLNFPRSINQLKELFNFKVNIRIWVLFFLLVTLFWGIGSGMAIMDDFQTLPLISQMAAGDLPLHFPLDPKVIYNYHYFPYLFSAQIMRLGDIFPWTALDLEQALFLSLGLVLLGLWIYRITQNRMASIAASIFYFFSGGTRWLLLLFPKNFLEIIDHNINRIGSGLNSGSSLQAALSNPWAAQGTGPFTIPFAFANGFNAANSIGLGYTNLALLFLVILLLTFNLWRNWKALLVYVILLSSLALSHEITFVLLILGFILVSAIYLFKNKTIKLPKEMIFFLVALSIAGVISLFQGGVISGVFDPWMNTIQNTASAGSSFHNQSISFAFPPAFIDAHLGVLSVFNPFQMLVWLVEVGPMILLLGLALPWGVKAFNDNRWLEVILSVIIIISLILVFFNMEFKATSIGAFTRAQDYFLLVLKIFAIPILFVWLPKRSEMTKIITYFLLTLTLFGGVVIFGLEMTALQKPILTTFIEPLDAKIMREYWNKLDPLYMVFDPGRMRSAVLFGHPSDVGFDWLTNKPKWIEFFNNPDPTSLQKAGFGYLYSDGNYLKSLPPSVGKRLESPCVKVLADYKDDFGGERILLDVRVCQ